MSTPEVKLEDQQNINSYSKLNQRFHEIEAELKAYKEDAENLEEASNEIMITDEEEVKYMMGECFVYTTEDEANELIDAANEKINSTVEGLQEEKASVAKEMAKLKTLLKDKFGNSINLDEDP